MYKIKKQKSPRKLCDELWAEKVKKRANGCCEKCFSTNHLSAHHIYPRTIYALRYDLQNGVALCKRCHLYWAHKNALEFVDWIKTIRNIEYLESRRHSQSKNDYKLIEIMLKQKLNR